MDLLTDQRPEELIPLCLAKGIDDGTITDTTTYNAAVADYNSLYLGNSWTDPSYADMLALGPPPQKDNSPTGGDAYVTWLASAGT